MKISKKIKYLFGHSDVRVVSYPKSGRTWLRILIGRALYGPEMTMDEVLEKMKPRKFSSNIYFDHLQYSSNESSFGLTEYPDEKLILLVRDPRDVIVSSFYEHTERNKRYLGEKNISVFIRDKDFGFLCVVEYMNLVYEKYKDDLAILIKYEDLKKDTSSCVKSILNIISPNNSYSQNYLDRVIEACSFDKMKKDAKTSSNEKVAPVGVGDNGQKFRKGIVGGYVNELSQDDIDYVNQCMEKLNPAFNYAV